MSSFFLQISSGWFLFVRFTCTCSIGFLAFLRFLKLLRAACCCFAVVLTLGWLGLGKVSSLPIPFEWFAPRSQVFSNLFPAACSCFSTFLLVSQLFWTLSTGLPKRRRLFLNLSSLSISLVRVELFELVSQSSATLSQIPLFVSFCSPTDFCFLAGWLVFVKYSRLFLAERLAPLRNSLAFQAVAPTCRNIFVHLDWFAFLSQVPPFVR